MRGPRFNRGWLIGVAVAVAVSVAGFAATGDSTRTSLLSLGRSSGTGHAPITPIQHVVFILKENRSFDEYFGKFPGADGATTGVMSNGKVVPLLPTPDPLPNELGHDPQDWVAAYDGGKMDGFDKEQGAFSAKGQNLAYTQMSQSQIPNYWAYAAHYELGDRFFAGWKGASFTNGLFEVSAQAGQYDASIGYRSVYGNPISQSRPHLNAWGCDDPIDTQVAMIAPNGTFSESRPCFDFPTLANVLTANHVSWRSYADPSNFVHVGLDAIRSVRDDPGMWANIRTMQQFAADAAAGTLPAVSWVTMPSSEHPVQTTCAGENESTQVINSLTSGPEWSSTAVFMAWDEWGGFYDHVKPPQTGMYSYGFRVPLLVFSPYTKPGKSSDGGSVNHTFYSQESELKFAEVNWNLPALTPRDKAANNMLDLFDFTQKRPPLLLKTHPCPALTAAQQATLNQEEASGDND
jgi:phospholipase C